MTYVWQRKEWPRLSWRAEALAKQLGQTRLRQGRLLCKLGSLALKRGVEAAAEILAEEAVKTSAIEGERLSLDSVRSSVARRLGLPTAGLPATDRRTDGLIEVLLDATAHYNKPLTPARLKAWHAALFPTGYSGLHKIRAGKWRGPEPMKIVSGPVGRETIHFEAPPGNRIEREMRSFLAWWKKSLKDAEGFIRAGVAHFYFVTIHPFEDGNGRIARALTDMALAQDEKSDMRCYSLSSQIMSERSRYYEILERTQKGSTDITDWLLWFLSCSERAIQKSEVLLSTVLLEANLWQRFGQMELSKRQRKVINRLIDAGQGGFEGGLTTRKYVSLSRASRATAYREIADLVEKGVLRAREGRGRNASYDLVWPEDDENR